MRCWRVLRFASTLIAFALLLALTACGGGRMVPAPVGSPQSPSAGAPIPAAADADAARRRPGQGGAAAAAVGRQCRSRQGDAGGRAARPVHHRKRAADPGSRATPPAPRRAPPARRDRRIADGAQLILGPLLAAEVEAVKPVARDAKVNVIAFSTATQLAGGNVFLMGFLPRQEVVREVVVRARQGAQPVRRPGAELAVRSPDDRRLARGGERERRLGRQGRVSRSAGSGSRGGDQAAAVVGRCRAAGPGRSAAASPPPASAAFDALLLPEGGAQLKQIARQLKEAGLDPAQVRLLGSGLWDDPSIAGEPALDGGWFAASPPEPRREFESRFQATYGHPAPRLASLAFDAAALAAVLGESGGAEPFSREAILNPSGFTGVDGLFRFTPQGLVQRGLAVLEVEPQGNVVVSPAPQNFQDFSY